MKELNLISMPRRKDFRTLRSIVRWKGESTTWKTSGTGKGKRGIGVPGEHFTVHQPKEGTSVRTEPDFDTNDHRTERDHMKSVPEEPTISPHERGFGVSLTRTRIASAKILVPTNLGEYRVSELSR